MAARKGPSKGTGGHGRRRLEGRGPTPRAEDRPGHPAQRRARSAMKQSAGRQPKPARDAAELVVGRNPVVEALRARVPANALYVALGADLDDRVAESVRI